MKKQKNWLCAVYIVFYGALQLLFLTRFPLVHSDESWLGGLARNMMATGSIGCTEPFFDAKPRYPHAIKTLFHLLQQGAIRVFGYNPFALRLLSVIAACACLAVFYFCVLRLFQKRKTAFLLMILLSADIQFLYAAHFARSEIFILLFLCVCLWALCAPQISRNMALLCAVATGTAVFFHPNSFFLACACGCALLYRCKIERKGLRPLFWYCGVTGAFAAAAVAISFALDKDFVRHYLAYGQGEFDLLVSPGEKITGLFGFFARLWQQNSGTYYVPHIRVQMLLFLVCAVLCTVFACVMRKEQACAAQSIFMLLCVQTGLLAGIALVGRLNQTSIVFLLPSSVLLLGMAAKILAEEKELWLVTLCIGAFAVLSTVQIIPFLQMPTYEQYTMQLASAVPASAKTIANLNTGFYFENDALLDYRNLPFALKTGTLDDYVHKNKVQYIVYSDELDYIYEHRPYYNVIYGNALFVKELRQFCAEKCEPVGSFQNIVYGTRINALSGNSDYGKVTIYKVKEGLLTA